MNNGIKPTRLYRLSGKKHIRRLIQGREKAVPPHNQRDRPDAVQLLGMIGASVVGLAYTFGILCPPDPSQRMGPPPPCRVKKHKVNQDPKNPCPPEEPPELPKCKGEDTMKDDRSTCKYDV